MEATIEILNSKGMTESPTRESIIFREDHILQSRITHKLQCFARSKKGRILICKREENQKPLVQVMPLLF